LFHTDWCPARSSLRTASRCTSADGRSAPGLFGRNTPTGPSAWRPILTLSQPCTGYLPALTGGCLRSCRKPSPADEEYQQSLDDDRIGEPRDSGPRLPTRSPLVAEGCQDPVRLRERLSCR
jgi:hypothetical protein